MNVHTDSVVTRFWGKAAKGTPDECWAWLGSRNHRRSSTKRVLYGRFWLDGRMAVAHRVAFELEKGPVPRGLGVLHTCDNGLCVNPAHLYAGTALDNAKDATQRKRRRLGSRHTNSKLTEPQAALAKALRLKGVGPIAIAARFSVDVSTIWAILRGRTWKHVEAALLEEWAEK